MDHYNLVSSSDVFDKVEVDIAKREYSNIIYAIKLIPFWPFAVILLFISKYNTHRELMGHDTTGKNKGNGE